MAWPPPVLPINRTNADPQQDTHPADHNALALAMNDTVATVRKTVPIANVAFWPIGAAVPPGTVPQIVTGGATVATNAGGTGSVSIPGAPGPLGMILAYLLVPTATAPGQDINLMVGTRDSSSVLIHATAGGAPYVNQPAVGFNFIAFIA